MEEERETKTAASRQSGKPFPKRAYPVLAPVSRRCSEPKGMFPRVTHPSATPPCEGVRLACVKPAASVRSEPGSNSQVVDNSKPQTRLITVHVPARSQDVLDESQTHPLQPKSRSAMNLET
ncbi:hypothetical protein FH972_027203 [Carpinus fangiana]|uniref:Uncharacterized protein n=1 Tax=Carpinus fangiana TaxID=176857 RepID=A0A5N6L6H7_9ROSI|nr:hypothetical protein FH972_027203 [Carpinus fangiana]